MVNELEVCTLSSFDEDEETEKVEDEVAEEENEEDEEEGEEEQKQKTSNKTRIYCGFCVIMNTIWRKK